MSHSGYRETAESGRQIAARPRWLAENADKAWGEKFFLLYTPLWIGQVALATVLGWSTRLSEAGLLLHAALVWAPLLVVPWLWRVSARSGLRWYQSYWFKANVYIALFSLLGNYFGSEYFFDVLGMVYKYPQLHLTFDAALVGSGRQSVPLIMYLLTPAYFMTYHTTAVVALRRLRTAWPRGAALVFPLAVGALAYGWAWLETFAMANPLLREVFYYHRLERMLTYGSAVYACFFITSFPIFYFLDETESARWSLKQTVAAALAAAMLTFWLLDLLTHVIGSI